MKSLSIIITERRKTNLVILSLIGLVLFAAISVFLVMAWMQPEVAVAPAEDEKVYLEPMDLRQLHQSWLDEVARQTRGIDSRTDPQKVRQTIDALLKLKVTAGDKEEHLRIVMALLALERHESGAWSQVQSALASLPAE
ncbi:MAG: hypothetical protein WC551_01830 [Patescibacteria group bacterium]